MSDCSLMADQIAHLAHLNARDTTLVLDATRSAPGTRLVRPFRMLVVAELVLSAVVISGCMDPSTTAIARSGAVGQTLRGPGGLQVQVVRYLPRVPSRRDVSGLATPAPRTHFAAFVIRMCVATVYLPTIAPQSFHLVFKDGAEARLKFPQTVFANDLDLLGEPGCERGHIVFQVPRSERPNALRFYLDWAKTDMQGFANATKLRFEWTLSAGTAARAPAR